MANEGVNIPIKTTADTSGEKAASASLKNLQKELKETQKQMRALGDASPEFAPLKEKAAGLEKQIETLGDSQEKAAGKGVNFGQSMLQGSRAVQDFSAAGIPGMVNNVESLASALGLGASAAGGFTLAFVAIEVLIRNWDTWFGEEKAKQVKDFWAAITPEEAQITRIREMNEQLEAQAANYERIAESQKAARKQQAQELDFLKQRAELWKGIVQTPEERGDLPSLTTGPKVSDATMEAQAKLKDAQSDTQRRVNAFRDLDKAAEEQRQRVENINKIATLPERVKFANDRDARTLAGLDTSFDDSGSPNSPEQMRQAEQIRAQIKQREKDMRAQLQSVPGLTDGLTGDPEKDNESLQAKAQQEREQLNQLEQKRLAAAREAEAAAKAQAEAEGTVKQQVNKDKEAFTAPFFKDIGGLDLPPPTGQFSGADSRAGIDVMNQQINQAQQQVSQALQSNGGAVVESLSTMQNGLVGVLSAMVQKVSEINSFTRTLESDVNTLRSQVNP